MGQTGRERTYRHPFPPGMSPGRVFIKRGCSDGVSKDQQEFGEEVRNRWMKDQAEADPENHKTFMLPGGRRSDRSVWRGGWCVRTAQTRAPVVVRLPRESVWSEKRAIPEPLPTAAHKVEEEPAGASFEGERESGPRGGRRGSEVRSAGWGQPGKT